MRFDQFTIIRLLGDIDFPDVLISKYPRCKLSLRRNKIDRNKGIEKKSISCGKGSRGTIPRRQQRAWKLSHSVHYCRTHCWRPMRSAPEWSVGQFLPTLLGVRTVRSSRQIRDDRLAAPTCHRHAIPSCTLAFVKIKTIRIHEEDLNPAHARVCTKRTRRASWPDWHCVRMLPQKGLHETVTEAKYKHLYKLALPESPSRPTKGANMVCIKQPHMHTRMLNTQAPNRRTTKSSRMNNQWSFTRQRGRSRWCNSSSKHGQVHAKGATGQFSDKSLHESSGMPFPYKHLPTAVDDDYSDSNTRYRAHLVHAVKIRALRLAKTAVLSYYSKFSQGGRLQHTRKRQETPQAARVCTNSVSREGMSD